MRDDLLALVPGDLPTIKQRLEWVSLVDRRLRKIGDPGTCALDMHKLGPYTHLLGATLLDERWRAAFADGDGTRLSTLVKDAAAACQELAEEAAGTPWFTAVFEACWRRIWAPQHELNRLRELLLAAVADRHPEQLRKPGPRVQAIQMILEEASADWERTAVRLWRDRARPVPNAIGAWYYLPNGCEVRDINPDLPRHTPNYYIEKLQRLEAWDLPEWTNQPGTVQESLDRLDSIIDCCQAAAEQAQGATGTPPEAVQAMDAPPRRRGTVSQRMRETMSSDPNSLNWSQRKWARELHCSPSAIAGAPAWQTILKAQALSRASKVEDPSSTRKGERSPRKAERA
jgi:hypothetical protein